MQSPRRLFRLGAAVMIAGGVAHFLMVDLGTLWLRTEISRFVPSADVVDTMRSTTLTFGLLGKTTPFLATAGMSLWTALSLVFLGVVYVALGREPELRLRPFIALGAIISAVFLVVSATCLIAAAAVGAAAALGLFCASALRGER